MDRSRSASTESPIDAFLARVDKGLDRLSPRVRGELLRDLQTHFADGLAAGEPAEGLVARMGDPLEVAAGLEAEHLALLDRGRGSRDYWRLALAATLGPGLAGFALTLAGLAIAAWLLPGELPSAGLRLLFAMWAGLFGMGLLGWPLLARQVPDERRWGLEVRQPMFAITAAAALGVALLVLCTGLVFEASWLGNTAEIHAIWAQWQAAFAASDAARMAALTARYQHLELMAFGSLAAASATLGVMLAGLSLGFLRARGLQRELWQLALLASGFVAVGGAGWLAANTGWIAASDQATWHPPVDASYIGELMLASMLLGHALVLALWAFSFGREQRRLDG